MNAIEKLREGDADGALALLQNDVRRDPSNVKQRIFLFQLLAVLGQWDRAFKQLNVAGELDAKTLAMVQVYREALKCEVFRKEVFSGAKLPLIFGNPEDWTALLLEALRLTVAGKFVEAQGLRDQAFDKAPAVSGSIDGESFSWIADADTRLGPVVEAVVNGRYYWIPFSRIKKIDIEEPEDLRDVVWTPAHFTWANGGEAVGFIPTRYPGSEAASDGLIKLARKTTWTEFEGDAYIGLGQRMWATDAGEFSLMDVRSVELDLNSSEPGQEAEIKGD